MRNVHRFLLAGAAGLLLAGFVMGAALPSGAARTTSASCPVPKTGVSCPALTPGGIPCPALEREPVARELRLRAADVPASGHCPARTRTSCPFLTSGRTGADPAAGEQARRIEVLSI